MQTQMSWIFCQRPCCIIWIVVPLPLHAEFISIETIVGWQVSSRVFLAHVRFLIRLAILAHIDAILTDNRPSVFPYHRLQIWDTTDCTGILEEDGPPLTCLRFYQSTLMDVLLFEESALMFLIRTERILRTEDGLAAIVTSSIGGIDIIIITNMIHVTALQTSVWLVDDLLIAADSIEVFIQFRHTDVIDASHNKSTTSSLIKQESRVVVETIYLLHLPLPLRVGSGQEEVSTIGKLVVIERNEVEIELTLVIFEAWCPLTLGILIVTILEIERLGVGNLLKRIGTILPIHQVMRLENGSTRKVEHRGRYIIIGIAHTDDVRIRKISIDDRIGIGTVTIVGTPLLGEVLSIHLLHGSHQTEYDKQFLHIAKY